MNEREHPAFYSILPADIRYDEELTATEKLLFSEITALCSKSGSCWANNQYFADLFHKDTSTISRIISHLAKKKKIFIAYRRRGAQITDRAISIIQNSAEFGFTDDKKIIRSNDENITGPNDKNVKYNNTSINKKKNNKKKNYSELKNVILSEDEYEKLKLKFPTDFNEKIENLSLYIASTGKKYKNHYATILAWDRRDRKGKRKDEYQQL